MLKRKQQNYLIPTDDSQIKKAYNTDEFYEFENNKSKSMNIELKDKKDNKSKIKEKEQIKYYHPNKIYIMIIKLMIINLFQILINNKINKFENLFSNITLKIKGIGTKNILGYNSPHNFSSKYYPDEIYINGIKQNVINYSYYFNLSDNLVELIWNNTIKSLQNMFCGCTDITEIDFEEFDTSQIITMNHLFYDCISILQ